MACAFFLCLDLLSKIVVVHSSQLEIHVFEGFVVLIIFKLLIII